MFHPFDTRRRFNIGEERGGVPRERAALQAQHRAADRGQQREWRKVRTPQVHLYVRPFQAAPRRASSRHVESAVTSPKIPTASGYSAA